MQAKVLRKSSEHFTALRAPPPMARAKFCIYYVMSEQNSDEKENGAFRGQLKISKYAQLFPELSES